jgi:metallo-beta-lactamase family protein
MKIKFLGATESVTGSKHLLITENKRQYLLDCGLFQGMGRDTEEYNRKLDLNPSAIEAVILSHAHIDHSGNLPGLYKQGFRGKIYCTPATQDVCRVLLMDSAHIQESDIRFLNKRRKKKGLPLLKPLYTIEDAEECIKLFKSIPYQTDFRLSDEVAFRFTESGHIIGAASVHVTAIENGKTTKITYTGDVGRYNDAILRSPSEFDQADYIICESTYGDKLHDSYEDADEKLLQIINETCIKKGGKLIIPAFSLGRTQEVLYAIDKLKGKNLIPDVKVFVDSPLSSKVTEIVNKNRGSFNEKMQKYMEADSDPFGFAYTRFIEDVANSKTLNKIDEPCVIISASGMADAGRVKHHISHTISNAKNTILMIGYCAPGTLGARLINGEKQVRIFGEEHQVNAEIASLLAFSAHADANDLLRFLSCQDKSKLKAIFLVHGEEKTKQVFRGKLIEQNYRKIIVPAKGLVFNLD